MIYIEWKDEYSVGIKLIDDQHKKLISMINDLYTAMGEGQGNNVIGKIINEMTQYAAEHFATEERLFDRHKYPDAVAHRKEHADFVKEVLDFKGKFDKGAILLSMKILDFLKQWLMNHILKNDKKYGPFLNQKGER